MDYLILESFLSGKTKAEELLNSFREELLRYIQLAYKTNSMIEVKNEELFNGYNSDRIKLLLSAYLKGEILEWDLDYILNALDLMETESMDERANKVVFNLSNPEIGLDINSDNVNKLLLYLNGADNLAEMTYENFDRKMYRTKLKAINL